MSEHLPAEITIGGKVRRSMAEAMCEVIAGEGVALDWGEARFRPQTVDELLAARSDDGDDVTLLRLCDDQASWGEFEELETFLRDNDIAYIRHSDGKYDLDPEGAAFHPDTGLVQWLTDHNRNPVVKASNWSRSPAPLSSSWPLYNVARPRRRRSNGAPADLR